MCIRDREPPAISRVSVTPEQEYQAYETMIRSSIQYQALILDHPQEKEQIDEIVALLTETCCSKKDQIRIGSEERPAGVVRSKLLHLTPEHIRYVMECLRQNTTKIWNIRQYLLTVDVYKRQIRQRITGERWSFTLHRILTT